MPSTTPATPEDRGLPPPKGPHPSHLETAKPYIFEHQIQAMLRTIGISEAVEESSRVHGVGWIDGVRKSLFLPVRTYDTACIYYHKFRLTHRDDGYDYRSAAAAALFVACKIEDTPKKSREILAAAFNLHKPPHEHLAPDSPSFDDTTKTIHVLERLMLESSGFDFRNRYPQKLLVKLAKHALKLPKSTTTTAFAASLDLYRTFAPLKQTAATMALAALELAARLADDAAALAALSALDLDAWASSRAELLETLLDLLELYAHAGKSTLLGAEYPLDALIPLTIALRKEREAADLPRYTMGPASTAAPVSPAAVGAGAGSLVTPRSQSVSPASPGPVTTATTTGKKRVGKGGGREGTVRFLLDAERAAGEAKTVADFFEASEVVEYV